MSTFYAALLEIPGHVLNPLPAIIDAENQQYTGFLTENGNAHLAAVFTRNSQAALGYTWHPIPEEATIS
jgi:hypothetical protein